MAATLRVIMMAQNGNGGASRPQAEAGQKPGAKAAEKHEAPQHPNGYFGPKQIDAYFKKIGPFLGC